MICTNKHISVFNCNLFLQFDSEWYNRQYSVWSIRQELPGNIQSFPINSKSGSCGSAQISIKTSLNFQCFYYSPIFSILIITVVYAILFVKL